MSFMIDNLLKSDSKEKNNAVTEQPNNNYGSDTFYQKENFEENVDEIDEFDEDEEEDEEEPGSLHIHHKPPFHSYHAPSSSTPNVTMQHAVTHSHKDDDPRNQFAFQHSSSLPQNVNRRSYQEHSNGNGSLSNSGYNMNKNIPSGNSISTQGIHPQLYAPPVHRNTNLDRNNDHPGGVTNQPVGPRYPVQYPDYKPVENYPTRQIKTEDSREHANYQSNVPRSSQHHLLNDGSQSEGTESRYPGAVFKATTSNSSHEVPNGNGPQQHNATTAQARQVAASIDTFHVNPNLSQSRHLASDPNKRSTGFGTVVTHAATATKSQPPPATTTPTQPATSVGPATAHMQVAATVARLASFQDAPTKPYGRETPDQEQNQNCHPMTVTAAAPPTTAIAPSATTPQTTGTFNTVSESRSPTTIPTLSVTPPSRKSSSVTVVVERSQLQARAHSTAAAAPNSFEPVNGACTPKRDYSSLQDDMYRKSPIINTSSIFATAMTSLYGEPPLDVEPLAHTVFRDDRRSVPSPVGSPHPLYGSPVAHMLQQYRGSPARSIDSSERSGSPFEEPFDPDVQEPSRKKARTTFTTEQLRGLEKIFTQQRYLSASDRTSVARKLHLNDFQVKTWFQNRRIKEKKQVGMSISQLRASESFRSSPRLSTASPVPSGGDDSLSESRDAKDFHSEDTPVDMSPPSESEPPSEIAERTVPHNTSFQPNIPGSAPHEHKERSSLGLGEAEQNTHDFETVPHPSAVGVYQQSHQRPHPFPPRALHGQQGMPPFGNVQPLRMGHSEIPESRPAVPTSLGRMPVHLPPSQNPASEKQMLHGPFGHMPRGPDGHLAHGPSAEMPRGPIGHMPHGPPGDMPRGPIGHMPHGPPGEMPRGPIGHMPHGPPGDVPRGPIGHMPHGPPVEMPRGPIGHMPHGPPVEMPRGPIGHMPHGPPGEMPRGPIGHMPHGPPGEMPHGPPAVMPRGPVGYVAHGLPAEMPRGPIRHMPSAVRRELPEDVVATVAGHMPPFANVPPQQTHPLLNRPPVGGIAMDYGHIPRTMPGAGLGPENPSSYALMVEQQRMHLLHTQQMQSQMSQFGPRY